MDGDELEIAREVTKIESELCVSADLILSPSHRDRRLFNRFYEIPFDKMRIIRNGVPAEAISARDGKAEAKKTLRIEGGCMAIFVGGSDQSDVEAAEFVIETLAPALPDVEFAICGQVASALQSKARRGKGANIRFADCSDATEKSLYFSAADLAINPMTSCPDPGAKMIELMASGLPIVTSPAGAGEIEQGPDMAYRKCLSGDFVDEVGALADDPKLRAHLSEAAVGIVREKYSWERISANAGRLLHRWRARLADRRPFFSVVIPSYDRHESLGKLMNRLSSQSFRDFEVIIVDQTGDVWSGGDEDYGFDLMYVHTDIKGAVRARNMAGFFARGEVIAYTDDDCEPSPDWLENARRYFERPGVVGVEGLIESDKRDDPDYRTVSNEGFEGMGFLTANLFLRLNVFDAVNGFDERFDDPHFREDTDLAWRALAHGEIPFARDVAIFHPPHPRGIERESVVERSRFFEKDALLLKKHPQKYKTLFMSERHWERTPGFWENFLRGAKKYGIDLHCDVSVIGS